MAYTLPKGPRGDSPSDKGRRGKATKKPKKAGTGNVAGPPTPAGRGNVAGPPTPKRPKPGARSTGKAVEKAGAKAGPPTPKPSPSGDRPSDRPDANAKRKAEVERQRRRDERKSRLIAALSTVGRAADKPVEKVDESRGLTKLIKDRAKDGPSVQEVLIGKDRGGKQSKADAAVQSVAVKILDETTRVARGVGEGIKASGGKPTDPTKWPDMVKASGKAIVTNKGDMPGDAVVPKDKKGAGWDAARLAGNIAGDPLTYVTVGAGTATRASAKAAAKKATKKAVKQGASKKAADRAGRAAAKKVATKRAQNNRGVSVGLRATVPFTSRPILDIKTSGRGTAAVSRAVKAPQAADKVRAKASGPVRTAPGTQSVRPAGRTPVSHTKIKRAQRELRARQDTARREGAEVKRAVKKATRKAKTTGAEVYDRIETTPQGVSLGMLKDSDVARLVRHHLGRSFDEKRAAGLADKPFRPRDIETRVQPAVKVVRDKAGETTAKQTSYKTQVKVGGKWQTVARAGTKKEAEALRKQVQITADDMVKRGRLPKSDDARRYAPHMRQPQTESVAPVPLATRQTRTNAEKAREIRKPLADANAEAVAGSKVKRNPDDVKNDLFTDDIATTTGLHAQRAGEKSAEARFWGEVAKTGKPLGQVARVKNGVLDISELPKGAMVYRQDERGLHALAKGNSGELDTEAVRKAIKESGTDGNRFVVLDPQEVDRVRERVFPKGNPRTDDAAQWFDRATGKIKWWLTIPNPSYHVRNIVGDTNLAWLGDANARSMLDATLVMRGRTAAQRAAARGEKAATAERTINLGSKAKGSKQTFTHDELLKEAQDVGSISLGQGGKELDDLIHAGGKQGGTFDSGPASALSRLNMRREDVPRLASHIAARRRGLTPQEAADWVNKHHFDYGDLNKADRGLRRVVPFATWWTRNTPLQVVKLVERPGKYATMAKVLDAAAKQAGFEDYEAFAGGLNTWQQDGIPVPVRTPWDGRLKVANIGPPQTDLNFHDWIKLMSGEGGDDVAQAMGQDFLSRLNPLIKLPLELQQNRSFFFRGDIDAGQEGKGTSLEPAPDMPAPLRDFFGVVRYKDKRDGKEKWGWDKTVAYAVRQSLPLANRAVGIATPGMSDRNQTSGDAIASFAGVNLVDFDSSVEKATTNRKYERRDELRGRKRYLEDTQKTKGKEYRKVVVELKVLERELAPERKKARKKSGFGKLLGGSSGGGGGLRGILGSSRDSGSEESSGGGAAPERSARVDNDRQQNQASASNDAPQGIQAPASGDGERQYVAQATPATSIPASSREASVGSNEPELRSYAREVAEDVGLDPNLYEAQIEAESNFDPNAGSPAGAQGVAQIMPDTAAAWGVDPMNPRAALKESAKRMKGYIDKYDGDVEKALAAYNAGEGAVAQYGGVPPFAETRNYIAKIKAKAGTLREQGSPAQAPARRGTAAKRGADEPIRDRAEIVPTEARSTEERAAIASYLLNRGKPGSVAELAQNLAAARAADDQVEAVAQSAQRTTGKAAAKKATKKQAGFTGKAGGGWGGSEDPAAELAAIGTALGLKVTSTKRDNKNPYSGKGSDHDHGNKNAFAYDLSNGNSPTKEMDRAAFRIARALGIRDYKFGTPIMRKVRVGDVRVQIIYRGSGPSFGGNHMNHVHVGVSRV